MKISYCFHWPFCRELFYHAAAWMLLAALFGAAAIAAEPTSDFAAAPTASIVGTVSNAGTGNLLEGARVELPALAIAALADRTGRFMLNHIPAGTHEIVASYTGLDSKHGTINVTLGERVIRDFDLTAPIYRLGAFIVNGEREGTRRRPHRSA